MVGTDAAELIEPIEPIAEHSGESPMLMKFRSRNDAAEMLAGSVAAILRAAAAAHGSASLVVSGGESPRGLFELLSTLHLPWEDVTVVPSDERWVPPEHADSNEGMIRRCLLKDRASGARLVSLYRRSRAPDEALPEIDAALATVKRPLDVVILGMGPDGHTASLFPGSPDIDCALDSDAAVVVQHVPTLEHARISLTPRSLVDAHEINLLFFGARKLDVYWRAVDAGPVSKYPVRAILNQTSARVAAYWAP
jgi:6-phosphogluconolactonase